MPEKLKTKLIAEGYAIVGLLAQNEVDTVKEYLNEVQFQYLNNLKRDQLRYNSSFFEVDVASKKTFYNNMSDFFQAKISELLGDYDILMANFWEKKPGDGEVIVHQNWTHVDETNNRSYSVWIPLQDTNSSNGTMWVVPRSHKIYNRLRGLNIDHLLKGINEEIKQRYLIPIDIKAGQAVIIDDAIIHYTSANQSSQPRLAIQLVVKPRNVSGVFYYKHRELNDRPNIERFEADADFYVQMGLVAGFTPRPAFGISTGFVEQPDDKITIDDFRVSMVLGRKVYYADIVSDILIKVLRDVDRHQQKNGAFLNNQNTKSSLYTTAAIAADLSLVNHETAQKIARLATMFLPPKKNFSKLSEEDQKNSISTELAALCSYSVKRYGDEDPIPTNWINYNRNKQGQFFRYFDSGIRWLRYPTVLMALLKKVGESRQQLCSVAETANVLLCLGESEKTQPQVEWLRNNLSDLAQNSIAPNLEELLAWYFAARAYRAGVVGLESLKDAAYCKLKEYLVFEMAMQAKEMSLLATLALAYFGCKVEHEPYCIWLTSDNRIEVLVNKLEYTKGTSGEVIIVPPALIAVWYAAFLQSQLDRTSN